MGRVLGHWCRETQQQAELSPSRTPKTLTHPVMTESLVRREHPRQRVEWHGCCVTCYVGTSDNQEGTESHDVRLTVGNWCGIRHEGFVGTPDTGLSQLACPLPGVPPPVLPPRSLVSMQPSSLSLFFLSVKATSPARSPSACHAPCPPPTPKAPSWFQTHFSLDVLRLLFPLETTWLNVKDGWEVA